MDREERAPGTESEGGESGAEDRSRRSFLKKLGLAGATGAAIAALRGSPGYGILPEASAQSGNTVDVTDDPYNAAGDGSTDDTDAIVQAANDAAPDGTVYFPAGTYLVGSGQQHPIEYPDDGSWDNLTWEGESFDSTTLKLAGAHDSYHTIFRMTPTSSITGATFRQLTLNGTQMQQNGRPGLGIKTDTDDGQISGTVTVENCHFTNFVSNCLTAERGSWEVRNCRFSETGERDNQLTGFASHAMSVFNEDIVIENTVFEGIWGADIDISTDGVSGHSTTVRNCISRGSQEIWDGFLKVNPGNNLCRVENTKIVDHVPQDDSFDARPAIKANPQASDDPIGTIELDNVLMDNLGWTGIDFPAAGTTVMNQVAIKNVNLFDQRIPAGIYSDMMDYGSSGTISVHNVGSSNQGDAVRLENASGSIQEVIYGGTTDFSQWQHSGVIQNATEGSPLEPDVPSESDIGPGGSGGGSGDAGSGGVDVPDDAVDVTSDPYSAAGDGSTDDTEAIRAAANEAAPDGTVYIPSGTYLVGSDRDSPFRYPGEGSWNNLTWLGEDPKSTQLVMATGKDSFHAFFRNESNVEGAEFRNLDMDARGAEQEDQSGGSSCITFQSGTGTVVVKNCIFRDPIGGNVRIGGDLGLEVQTSEFYESGNVNPDRGGHSITFIPDSPQQCNVSDSLFKGDKGGTLKFGREEVGVDRVTASVENCYIEGPRLTKLDPENDTTVFNRINFNSIESELFPHDGISTNVNNANCGALEITNSVLRGPMEGNGISIGSASDVGADAMDYIKIDNVDLIEPDQGNTTNPGDRTATGFYSEATEHRGGKLYIGNVGSGNDGDAVWFTERGPTDNSQRGSYEEIRHSGTTRLGDTAGVTVGNEVPGGSRLNPDVPSESEVGVVPVGSGGGGGGGSGGGGAGGGGGGGSTAETKTLTLEASGSGAANYYFRTNGPIRTEEFSIDSRDSSDTSSTGDEVSSTGDEVSSTPEQVETEAGTLGHKAVSPDTDPNQDPREIDADGNKYYVSPGGDDSQDGSYSDPWRTPKKAATEASPGDIVFFRGGEYTLQERLMPANSGTQDRKITFRNFPGQEPVLNAENLSYDWGGVVFIRDKSDIVINGLKLTNSDKYGAHILRSPRCTIKNCHVDRAHGAGIEAQGSDNISIKYNEVTRSSFGGDRWPAQSEIISVSRGPNPNGESLITDGFEVVGNLIHKPANRTKEGLDVHSGARNGFVAYNTVKDTERLGLYIGGGKFMARNIDVYGNVVKNCLHGIVLSSEEGGDVQNIRIFKNLLHDNEYDGIWVTSFRESAYENIENTQQDLFIYNNTSVDNQRNGFRMTEKYENVVVRNNIFSGNEQDQVTNKTSADVEFSHNCSSGPGNQVSGPNSINQNPMFVDSSNNNFRLGSESPCIDAGTSDLSDVPELESNFQINGQKIDIGSYETGGTTGTSGSGMDTLSTAEAWHSVLNSGVDTSGIVYDATEYSGSTLSQKVENAIEAMRSEADGRAVLWVPPGDYSWESTVNIVTGDIYGPQLIFDQDATVDVSADWAFDIDRSQDGSDMGRLTNDPRFQIHIYGGKWTLNGTGWLQANRIYRGLMAPTLVQGGTYGMRVEAASDTSSFCEGWTVRDAVFDGVDRPIYFNSGSADQQLFSNITFRDFREAIYNEGSSGQNMSYVNLVFEEARSDAVGIHFDQYSTGTIYNPRWKSSTGTLIYNDGNSTNPSILDAEVADGASLYRGVEPITGSGMEWAQAQNSPIVNQGGPEVSTPVVRSDEYSGSSVPERVENAISDLSDGGTVLIPGKNSINWNSTVSAELGGRDVNVMMPWNTRVDVTHSDWAFNITGNGHLGVYGGFWHGQEDSSKPGWLFTDAPNFDCAVNAVWFFGGAGGIHAEPRSKGTYRIFDTRIHNTATSESSREDNACVQIGGSGCSQMLVSHTHTTNTYTCYRFNSSVDDFEALKTPAHPFSGNNGSVYCDANAPLNGTWYNIKWEAYGNDGGTVFDNTDVSSAASATEPFVVGGSQQQTLWKGEKPRFFPSVGNDPTKQSFVP